MEYSKIKQNIFWRLTAESPLSLIGSAFLVMIFSFAFVLLFLCPIAVSAATVSVNASTTPAANDTFLARVNLDTAGAGINAIEGAIEISSSAAAVKVQEISLGGSVLTLWPDKPSLSVEGKKVIISFTGGAPTGFNQADALLFTLALTATEAEDIIIRPRQLTAYAGDGQGSPIKVAAHSLTLKIGPATPMPKNEWQNFTAADNLPPEPFTIVFGQDPYVAGGQKFLTFNAVDNGSGLDHYEIFEGDRPAVRSDNIYILAEQTNPPPVKVIAYDKAANSREETWQPPSVPSSALPSVKIAVTPIMIIRIIIPILILLILLTVLVFKLSKWKIRKK